MEHIPFSTPALAPEYPPSPSRETGCAAAPRAVSSAREKGEDRITTDGLGACNVQRNCSRAPQTRGGRGESEAMRIERSAVDEINTDQFPTRLVYATRCNK